MLHCRHLPRLPPTVHSTADLWPPSEKLSNFESNFLFFCCSGAFWVGGGLNGKWEGLFFLVVFQVGGAAGGGGLGGCWLWWWRGSDSIWLRVLLTWGARWDLPWLRDDTQSVTWININYDRKECGWICWHDILIIKYTHSKLCWKRSNKHLNVKNVYNNSHTLNTAIYMSINQSINQFRCGGKCKFL